MKVISIKQPWASLIVNGYKEYEFRSWKTNYRGKILIHASKSTEKENMNKFKKYNLEYPLGSIIGTANLTNCIEVTKELEEKLIKKDKRIYGNNGRTGYAFKLENISKLDIPIPAKGQLGLWNYNKDI